MKTKINFKQIILYTLFLTQPIFGMFSHGQSYEIAKDRYEELIRHIAFLPLPARTAQLTNLELKNNLHSEYLHQFCDGKNNILTFYHQLGKVSFTIKAYSDLDYEAALSLVVIDLLPKLFENTSEDPSFPRGKSCNIYHISPGTSGIYTCNDLSVPYGYNIFDSPYISKHHFAQIVDIDLFLYRARLA